MKLPQVTIAIPAYNEEKSIGQLLSSLLAQETLGFEVKEIVVYSDQSSDQTDQLVKAFSDHKVRLVRNAHRLGKARTQNLILKSCVTDVVAILDADVRISSQNFVATLISPILNGQAELTAARVVELPPVSFVDKCLLASFEFKNLVFHHYQQGHTIYTCHGRARAFSKKLYQQLSFPPDSLAEDAFSYLATMKLGMRYHFVPTAVVVYRLPGTWADHHKQSQRFFHGFQQLKDNFDESWLLPHLSLPKHLMIDAAVRTFISNPIYFSCYIFIALSIKITSSFSKRESSKWELATSSKSL